MLNNKILLCLTENR